MAGECIPQAGAWAAGSLRIREAALAAMADALPEREATAQASESAEAAANSLQYGALAQ
jgi:hypothetical protein